MPYEAPTPEELQDLIEEGRLILQQQNHPPPLADQVRICRILHTVSVQSFLHVPLLSICAAIHSIFHCTTIKTQPVRRGMCILWVKDGFVEQMSGMNTPWSNILSCKPGRVFVRRKCFPIGWETAKWMTSLAQHLSLLLAAPCSSSYWSGWP